MERAKPDWKDAPEWATQLVELPRYMNSLEGPYAWADDTHYQYLSGEHPVPHPIPFGDLCDSNAWKTDDAKLVENRPVAEPIPQSIEEANRTKDPNGWFPWYGGSMPVMEDDHVDVRCRSGREETNIMASACTGEHEGDDDDIVAWRLHEPKEQDEIRLIQERKSCFRPEIAFPYGGVSKTTTFSGGDVNLQNLPKKGSSLLDQVIAFLDKAAEEPKKRAQYYDAPGGENSMPKIVELFNTLTGHELTEVDGWTFMQILKMVRSRQGDYREDNHVDEIAYSAFKAAAAERAEEKG